MTGVMTLTVSQLNEYVKALLDSSELLSDIYIKGEISNFVNHYKSGHLYFSLKDSGGVLKAVMFRTSAQRLNFVPENGMNVIVRGRISAYPRDGVYQLYAEEIQPDGLGALYLAFEQLKEKLALKGMFDEIYKKPIPKYPKKIGLITADTGAAVADMKNIITRRYPLAEIIIYPSAVQGANAPEELCNGVRCFNTKVPVDTIIIGRGGGSIEDLWAFNNEFLAYEIFNSKIPVISAVGHETDFTICDFVADLRAPTPSAAAELAVPDISDISRTISEKNTSLYILLSSKVAAVRAQLSAISKSRMFISPLYYTERLSEKISSFEKNFETFSKKLVSVKREQLNTRISKISALSPLSVMSRGYSIVTDDNGKAISDSKKLSVGDKVNIKMKKGCASAQITETNKGDK